MKLQIKYEKEKFPIEIDNSATVKDLKRLIGKMKNCKISQIQLIYSAEVLQNSQTLESQINNLNKPISLFINEVAPKKKKKNSHLNSLKTAQFYQQVSKISILQLKFAMNHFFNWRNMLVSRRSENCYMIKTFKMDCN